MKNYKKFVSLILSVLLLFTLCSCAPKQSSIDFYFFNTQITVFTRGTTVLNATKTELENFFSSLEDEFSLDGENSIINAFNTAKIGDELTLSNRASKLFESAKDCYNFTDKKFNPAVFPLVELWGFYPNYPILNFTPPTQTQIDQTLLTYSMDFNTISYDKSNSKLVKTSNSKIDFGGLLKGYALDECAKILIKNGHTAGYISIGSSSVYILGADTLGIKNPDKSANTLLLSVLVKGQNNLSVSTSGDYEKTYVHDGITYSHVIDARTGIPTNTGVNSATLISNTLSGELLDGLSTALCLCDFDQNNPDNELVRLLNKITEKDETCQFFVAIKNGEDKILLTNKKQGEHFTLQDLEYSIVNV